MNLPERIILVLLFLITAIIFGRKAADGYQFSKNGTVATATCISVREDLDCDYSDDDVDCETLYYPTISFCGDSTNYVVEIPPVIVNRPYYIGTEYLKEGGQVEVIFDPNKVESTVVQHTKMKMYGKYIAYWVLSWLVLLGVWFFLSRK